MKYLMWFPPKYLKLGIVQERETIIRDEYNDIFMNGINSHVIVVISQPAEMSYFATKHNRNVDMYYKKHFHFI